MLKPLPLSSLALLWLAAGWLTAQDESDPAAAFAHFVGPRAALPSAEELPAHLDELSAMLASPDPKLRDELAYTLLSKWLYRDRIVPVEQRRKLLAAWTDNLTRGVGEQGTDTVLLRSFSALSLGTLVALDNEEPWLSKAEFAALLTAASNYLRDERDLRGHDEQRGWLHSVAHAADLLKFLARSRHLGPRDQQPILTAISEKLGRSDTCFVAGEDARLARVALSIAAREDCDLDAFRNWLGWLVAAAYQGPLSETLAKDQNRRHLLQSLFALLSIDERKLPTLDAARAAVLRALRGLR